MPLSSSTGISLRSSSPLLVSDTVTRAPCAFINSAEATPDFPRPTTRARFPLSSILFISPRSHRVMDKASSADSCLIRASLVITLSLFQCRQREEREDQRCDPEAHDNFRFGPAQQFEMVVQGRHLEDAFLPQLIGADLQ